MQIKYCSPMSGDGGEGEASTDSNDDSQGKNDGKIIFNSQADFESAVLKAVQAKDKGEEKTFFDKRTEKNKVANDDSQSKATQIDSLQKSAIFDANFDRYIKENSVYFPDSTATIRVDVEGEIKGDIEKKSSLMGATASKEFFSKAENLAVLDEQTKALVQKEILDVRFENEIDGLKAWDYVVRAIFNHSINNDKNAGSYQSGSKGTGNTVFDKYIKDFYPSHIVEL
jgi:hypothetical protein